MATKAIETAASLDQATLDALREGIAAVLAEQSSSTAVHAFIDGKNSLDRELWSQAASLGWLGFGIPEQYGGLGLGAHGLAILHTEIGRQAAPGPYISTLSAAQAIAESGTDATRNTWLPRIASGEISAAVPATPGATVLTRSGTGVSGTLRCLGARDAAFVLAPAGVAWVIVELAGAEVNAMPMWDRTREVIDIRLQNAQPAAVLERSRGNQRGAAPGHGIRDRGGQLRRGPFRYRTNDRVHEDARAVRTTDRGVPGAQASRRRPRHEAGGDG